METVKDRIEMNERSMRLLLNVQFERQRAEDALHPKWLSRASLRRSRHPEDATRHELAALG